MEIFTNLITPFNHDGKIDYQALDEHIKRLIEEGNDNFIIGSNIGEPYVLTFLELKHLLRYLCYHYLDVSIYMTIKEIGTKKVIKELSNLKDIGNLKGYLIELPMSLKLNQLSLSKHLDLIATACEKSIIIKQNSKNKLTVNNLRELKERHENIIGLIVDQDYDSYRIICDYNFNLYLNEEMIDLNQPFNYEGLISNLSNLNYQKYKNLIQFNSQLDFDFFKLMYKYFYQENITSTIKYALYQDTDYKLCLPLSKIDETLSSILNKLMNQYYL